MKKIVTYMMALGMMFTAVPANAVFAAETPAIVSSAAETVEAVSIKELVGKWNYDVADKNADSVDEKPVCNGVVVIKEDGTYVYTDANGKITEGTVKTGIEEIGGTKHKTVRFYEGSEFKFGGYYEENTHNRISLGNGGMSRLLRDIDVRVDVKKLAGTWNYDVADKDADSVDVKSVRSGVVVIKENGTYVYTDANGKISEGTVKTSSEDYSNGQKLPTVYFYEGSKFKFGGYIEDSHNRISLGNGGMSRLVRVNTVKATLAGDANCDNNVDLSDSVLIMQSISNPSKYGVNGSDSHRITQQGLVNADCFNIGDGVTNADALAVQKYKLSLISSL